MSLVYCTHCGCAMPVSWGSAREVIGECCIVCGCELVDETPVRTFDRATLDLGPEQRADQPML